MNETNLTNGIRTAIEVEAIELMGKLEGPTPVSVDEMERRHRGHPHYEFAVRTIADALSAKRRKALEEARDEICGRCKSKSPIVELDGDELHILDEVNPETGKSYMEPCEAWPILAMLRRC